MRSATNPPVDDRSGITLRAEDHLRVETELGGWPAGITTYRIGETWICKIDNVSPGAIVARGRGATREEAVAFASARAEHRLAQTRIAG
jgi:hypothetical protein